MGWITAGRRLRSEVLRSLFGEEHNTLKKKKKCSRPPLQPLGSSSSGAGGEASGCPASTQAVPTTREGWGSSVRGTPRDKPIGGRIRVPTYEMWKQTELPEPQGVENLNLCSQGHREGLGHQAEGRERTEPPGGGEAGGVWEGSIWEGGQPHF